MIRRLVGRKVVRQPGVGTVGVIRLPALATQDIAEEIVTGCPIIDDFFAPPQTLGYGNWDETVAITPEDCALGVERRLVASVSGEGFAIVTVADGRLTFTPQTPFVSLLVLLALPAVDASTYSGVEIHWSYSSDTVIAGLIVSDGTASARRSFLVEPISDVQRIPWETMTGHDGWEALDRTSLTEIIIDLWAGTFETWNIEDIRFY